jgi:hypothetical protein
MMKRLTPALILIFALSMWAATTLVGTYVITGSWDASGATHTHPIKTGVAASKPATCTVGEEYFATDATAGTNEYYCTATNTWTQQTGTGGGGGGNATMTIDLPAGGVGSGIVTGPWDLGGNGGGGNLFYRGLDFSSSGAPGFKATFRLPANFDKTKTVSVIVTGSNVNGVGGAVLLTVQMACFGVGQATYSDPTYGTAASVSITQTADYKMVEGTASSLPLVAACDSDVMARVLVSRDNTVGSNLADAYTVHDVALKYGTK